MLSAARPEVFQDIPTIPVCPGRKFPSRSGSSGVPLAFLAAFFPSEMRILESEPGLWRGGVERGGKQPRDEANPGIFSPWEWMDGSSPSLRGFFPLFFAFFLFPGGFMVLFCAVSAFHTLRGRASLSPLPRKVQNPKESKKNPKKPQISPSPRCFPALWGAARPPAGNKIHSTARK